MNEFGTDINVGTIDRQQAIDALKDRYYKYGRFAKREELVWVIENLPSAQPEIIHCRECINRPECPWTRTEEDYCSRAQKRRDNE